MQAADLSPVLILPGLYDSGPQHWQSLWLARRPGFRRVEQRNWETPRRADRVGAALFARSWASRFVIIGAAGHINTASSLGDWPAGLELLHELADRATAGR
jgi:predicted alpha/beta hydrolase family esterase